MNTTFFCLRCRAAMVMAELILGLGIAQCSRCGADFLVGPDGELLELRDESRESHPGPLHGEMKK